MDRDPPSSDSFVIDPVLYASLIDQLEPIGREIDHIIRRRWQQFALFLAYIFGCAAAVFGPMIYYNLFPENVLLLYLVIIPVACLIVIPPARFFNRLVFQSRTDLLAKAAIKDMLITEDDFESESNYLGRPHPALRSMDTENRVIYMSCLSKVLSPGLRLGFMVAAPEVIAEARKLRRMMVKHPPLNNQRTTAFFLSLGHYDTFLMHLHETFEERWVALRRAVNYYLLHYVEITPVDGGLTPVADARDRAPQRR